MIFKKFYQNNIVTAYLPELRFEQDIFILLHGK